MWQSFRRCIHYTYLVRHWPVLRFQSTRHAVVTVTPIYRGVYVGAVVTTSWHFDVIWLSSPAVVAAWHGSTARVNDFLQGYSAAVGKMLKVRKSSWRMQAYTVMYVICNRHVKPIMRLLLRSRPKLSSRSKKRRQRQKPTPPKLSKRNIIFNLKQVYKTPEKDQG